MGSLPPPRDWSVTAAKARSIPTARMPTRYGMFVVQVLTDGNGIEHVALVKGTPADGCLVRLHSECATGDIFGSLRCDCRNQLEVALQRIDEAGEGVLIYLRGHEGRGIGLGNKILAYALQEQGMDTLDANVQLGFAPDARNYDAAVEILRHFGLSAVRLLTNNYSKISALEHAGIAVTERVSLWTGANPHNADYLVAVLNRMGHRKS
jgi:3,4-dihydroxy 2-butanone 4-phosphate synthase / GTP cyclohydrolase II